MQASRLGIRRIRWHGSKRPSSTQSAAPENVVVLFRADPDSLKRQVWFAITGVVMSFGIGTNFALSLSNFHYLDDQGNKEYAKLPLRIFGGTCAALMTVGCAAGVWTTQSRYVSRILLHGKNHLLAQPNVGAKEAQKVDALRQSTLEFELALGKWPGGPKKEIVPFERLHLNGPLNASARPWHPTQAFTESATKKGKFPRYTPILKVTDQLRTRSGILGRFAWPFLVPRSGTWRSQAELDALEKAMILNDRFARR